MSKENSLREQLKATSIKRLKQQIDKDNDMVGGSSNEYLSLEDGKTAKIRIFPAHPNVEDFYVSKKCYWIPIIGNDGEPHRTTVLDSKVHGGTKMDIIEEYVKWAKKKINGDADKLEALVGTGPKSNSLNPQYSWICYADRINGDDPLRAKLWEFKKMVRDAMNKLAFSEDDDEPIEVDPFTDPDDGLPIMVTYRKNPNRKRGENYYEVVFPKKVTARSLSDEEIEYFMSLKPLNELLSKYSIKDFNKALDGLQIFDESNDICLFDDEDWLNHVEDVKAQYDDSDDENDNEKKSSKKNKIVKKDEEDEDNKDKDESDDEEEEEDEEEEDEEEEDDDKKSGDKFDGMDRKGLKKYIVDNGLDVSVKKSMSDDDLKEAIKQAEQDEDNNEDDEEEEDKEPAKVSLADIRKKLAGKK